MNTDFALSSVRPGRLPAQTATRALSTGAPAVDHGPSERVTLSNACGSAAQPPSGGATGWMKRSLTALMVGLSLMGTLGLAACNEAAPAPTVPQPPPAPLVTRSTAEVQAATRNSVTADQLQPGQHRFTALGVDPDQASKHYHKPDSVQQDLDHAGQRTQDSPMFRECTSTNATTGKCSSSKTNQYSHVTLSCLYRDELDGQVYRVVHKSMEHFYTHSMDRMVCGGHQLKRDAGEVPSYRPSQTDNAGNQLYLNPNNVIAMLPAS